MPPPPKALILFAKAPKPGEVKTRLTPDLSAAEAARLYQAFVLDLVRATAGLKRTARIIGCDPSRRDPFFQSVAEGTDLVLIDQRGKDLGERMRHAFEDAAGRGFPRSVIIGTDSPTLPMKTIQKAFSLLANHDIVLGPSLDGGYYLIGSGSEPPDIFGGIPWGTDRVLELTLKRLTEQKIKCALLPFWYDVDTPRDLRFLSAHLAHLEHLGLGAVAPETSRVLKSIAPENVQW